MNLDHFGMDTITLAGPLEPKLRAVRAAGFTQIMLNASDIVGHPDGEAKYWIEPAVLLASQTGLSARQLADAQDIVQRHLEEIRDAWIRHFGR